MYLSFFASIEYGSLFEAVSFRSANRIAWMWRWGPDIPLIGNHGSYQGVFQGSQNHEEDINSKATRLSGSGHIQVGLPRFGVVSHSRPTFSSWFGTRTEAPRLLQ